MQNYKALGLVFVFIAVIFIIFFNGRTTDTVVPEDPEPVVENKNEPKITEEEIKEEYFTGKKPIIAGDGEIVRQANEYIERRIADFKKAADVEVPDMREQFGDDVSSANYSIEIAAKYLEGDKTKSIVLTEYAYTGGANGNSAYKVITGSIETGEILSLSDMIKTDQKISFTNLVKQELRAWRPDGVEGPVVFQSEVNTLSFDAFQDWSLDENNLVLYFDKYEIGPGALGGVAFQIPRGKIEKFLK